MVRDHYEGAGETARCRILLEGPVCRAWYLGERFLRQTLGLPEQIVPGPSIESDNGQSPLRPHSDPSPRPTTEPKAAK